MSQKPEDFFKNIISHCKEYGFIFQSSEIYDGLSAVYDYGQNGAELKKNIREYWWRAMVQMHENIVGIDAAIFMHPTTWKASGHVDAFNDPLIDNKDSKKRYRADVLIEEHVSKIEDKINKEVEKAAKRFENFDEKMFRETNGRVKEYQDKINSINDRFKTAMNDGNLAEVKQIIVDCEIVCPISGSRNWTDVRQFNLMFATKYGAVSDSDAIPTDKNQAVLHHLFIKGNLKVTLNELKNKGFNIEIPDSGGKYGDYILKPTYNELSNLIAAENDSSKEFKLLKEESDIIYLRPETAQGIFVNYLNVQKTGRMKIPFGIAQTGKAFRNEIVARQFIFRMREFEQMEMQFFVKPGEEMKHYEEWKIKRLNWHLSLGLGKEKYRFHDHLKLAHYANAACDIEYAFPFGFKELEGIHSRTDFDLKQHEQFSGKKLQYFDSEENKSYVPYVVETSVGLDRLFLSILSAAFKEETLEGGDTRTVLNLPPALAPIKAAIFPLVKKDGLPELAEKIMNELKFDHIVTLDEKDTVGKRYRRQDAIGTPFCITVDHQSLEDQTVTIRHRDTMQQDRVKISELLNILNEKVSLKSLLKQL